MIDRLFLRPPPGIADPSELRRLYGYYKAPPPQPDFIRASYNYPEIRDMQDALGTWDGNPRVYCRADDLHRARTWLEAYELRRQAEHPPREG